MNIKKQKPDKNVRIRAVAFAVILLVAVLGISIGSYWEKHSKTQQRGVITEDIGLLNRVAYQGAAYIEKPAMTTILLMGVDQTDQDTSYSARQGGQADFLMLLVIDHKKHAIYQLQIDRDAMTDVGVYGILGNKAGTRIMQICLAHGYGTTQEENNQNAVEAVQTLLQGVLIDYYLSFDLESIGILNDVLGGVTITLEDDFTAYDPLMTEGTTIRMNAEQAKILTSYRLEVGDGSNESRMARQRAFLKAAVALLKERVADQPSFADELFDALEDVMATNISKNQLVNEINTAYNYELHTVETLSGQYRIGDSGFMEFYVDEGAAMEWVLRVIYEPDDNTAGT